MIEQLHLIRPWWLLALIPLVLLFVLSLHKTRNSQSWKKVCDQALLPHVLTGAGGARSHLFHWLMLVAGTLAILAAAGPAWEKLPQPVFRDQSALVIAMDLSQSMNATDLKPSRLERARLKLLDILNARQTGQTALVVFADDAFTVTPLTDDKRTITNLAPTLTADLMPAQGSNVIAAIEKSVQLLQQAGSSQGHILLITDGIRQQDIDMLGELLTGRYRLSILGVGTADGSPIPLANGNGGGFVTDDNGAIVIARMDEALLRQAAAAGGGRYHGITNDDSDINSLLALIDAAEVDMQQGENDIHADSWREQGPWLLLLVVPLVALAARRGWLLTLTAGLTLFNMMNPQTAMALELDNLWRTPDQQAMQAFEQGDAKTAAETFRDPLWKASALYKQGNYEQAAKLLEQNQTADKQDVTPRLAPADLLYNKANALAKTGQLQQALENYEAALQLDPDHEDAAWNKKLVEDFLKQQQQQQNTQQGEQQNQQQENSQENNQGTNSQQDQSDGKQGDQQQNSPQQGGQAGKPDTDNQRPDGNSDSQASQNAREQQSGQQQAEQQNTGPDEQLEQQPGKTDKQQQQAEAGEQQGMAQQDENRQDLTRETGEQQPVEQSIEQSGKQKPDAEQDAQSRVTERWLQRVPDDPGGLMRRKFLYQYNQRGAKRRSVQPW